MNLDELDKLNDAAPPGAWHASPNGDWRVENGAGVVVFDDGSASGEYGATCSTETRDYIIALHNEYPTMAAELRELRAENERLRAKLEAPIPMRLHCSSCGELHIDEGEFATKPHHTHACQRCGNVWRPAVVATVGVRFLPGFKNALEPGDALLRR